MKFPCGVLLFFSFSVEFSSKKYKNTSFFILIQLDSVDDSGMFGQIAKGLADCCVVVMCISKEYSNSLNCQMEANFALRSLRRKVVVLEVGSGTEEDRTAWVRLVELTVKGKPYNGDCSPITIIENQYISSQRKSHLLDSGT